MEWMRNEKVFFCQDQNNSKQVFFIVPAGPSAISQATISLFDLTIWKKKKKITWMLTSASYAVF